MRNRLITTASLAGLALLGTACTMDTYSSGEPDSQAVDPLSTGPTTETAQEGVEVPEGVNLDEIPAAAGSAPLAEEEVWALDPANDLRAECTDPAALAANEGRDPAGWPSDWDGEGAMPNPECHPDFIEIHQWDRYEEFHACWEGIETSTASRTPDMSDDEAHRILWDQSKARADWESPADDESFVPPSSDCEETLEALNDI